MSFTPGSVCVTGGSGFVGLNLVETLLHAGVKVLAFDSRPPPHRARAEFEPHPCFLGWCIGDVREKAALTAALAESGADAMVHAAAITAGPSREKAEPDVIVSVNVGGSVAAITAASEMELKRVVLLSTAAVYGETARAFAVLDEDQPKRPESLYAVTKSAAEDIALRIGQLNGLSVSSARLGWLFGNWEHDTGVRDSLSLIFEATRAAKAGRAISPTGDEPRDWTPAPAAAAAIVRLLMAERPKHRVYNLGSGRRWRVSDWTRALADRLELADTTEPASPPARPSEGLLCGSRFAAEFDPVVTSTIEEDVEAYLAWLASGEDGNA